MVDPYQAPFIYQPGSVARICFCRDVISTKVYISRNKSFLVAILNKCKQWVSSALSVGFLCLEN
jgi:hypothetical protein